MAYRTRAENTLAGLAIHSEIPENVEWTVAERATIGRRSLAVRGTGQGFFGQALANPSTPSQLVSRPSQASTLPAPYQHPTNFCFNCCECRARPVSPCRSNRIYSIKLSRWAGGEQHGLDGITRGLRSAAVAPSAVAIHAVAVSICPALYVSRLASGGPLLD